MTQYYWPMTCSEVELANQITLKSPAPFSQLQLTSPAATNKIKSLRKIPRKFSCHQRRPRRQLCARSWRDTTLGSLQLTQKLASSVTNLDYAPYEFGPEAPKRASNNPSGIIALDRRPRAAPSTPT